LRLSQQCRRQKIGDNKAGIIVALVPRNRNATAPKGSLNYSGVKTALADMSAKHENGISKQAVFNLPTSAFAHSAVQFIERHLRFRN
jgi:hypothetical protein